jgi:hypothetical protein
MARWISTQVGMLLVKAVASPGEGELHYMQEGAPYPVGT